MTIDVYQRLATHLDNLPGGYPSTPDGLELRILQRIFSPEEAELAVHLTLIAEPARVIAHRAGIPVEEAEQRLESMAKRGQIYSISHKESPTEYQAMQFVIGIWEAQLNRLNEGLVKDVDEYFHTMFNHELWRKAPQLRTIPVGESIDARQDVLVYEQAEEIVRKQWKIVVADCICRKERHLVGEGCDKPMETCLVFGKAAEYYERNGLARQISVDEALHVLEVAEEYGLVLQPGNSQDPGNICCCCGDCCGVLRNAKLHPQPATVLSSAFIAYSDPQICSACETCIGRCQMEAISMDDGYAVVKIERCIGCGLCVTTCETGAMELQRKPDAETQPVPRTGIDSALQLGRARGKLGNRQLATMLIKSKADRLLALKDK